MLELKVGDVEEERRSFKYSRYETGNELNIERVIAESSFRSKSEPGVNRSASNVVGKPTHFQLRTDRRLERLRYHATASFGLVRLLAL
jgi:hypothetical protein